MNHEIELKLLIDRNIYRSLQHSLQNTQEPVKQHNIFFDTQQDHLKNQRWALRLRYENENSFLTLKGPATVKNGIHSRIEIEESINNELAAKLEKGFTKEYLPSQILSAFEFSDEKHLPFLEFQNTRCFKNFHGYSLELDHSIAYGEELYECEFENSIEIVEEISTLIQAFFSKNHWNFQPSSMNKLGWAQKCKREL